MAAKATQSEVCLQRTRLIISNYLQRIDNTSLLITWNVTNYSKLRKNTIYYQSCIDSGSMPNRWVMKLIKVGGTLFLILSTNSVRLKSVRFAINSGPRVRVVGNDTVEFRDGLYIGEFCGKVINDLRNEVLIDDTLTAHCMYSIKPGEEKFIVMPYKEFRETLDTFQLCDDIKSLLKHCQFVDFVIHVGVMTFRVHKLILAARSPFFSELFKNDFKDGIERNELDIDTQPAVMQVVLLYIYSGEWSQDLGDQSIIQVLHLANKLKLHCLIEKCNSFFKEGSHSSLGAHNRAVIATQSRELRLQSTVLIISNYLQRIDSTSLLITWNITNYSKLKKGTIYYQSSIDFGIVTNRWAMKLIKVRGTLFLILSTNAKGKLVHFMINSPTEVDVKSSGTAEIRDGLYVGSFCRKVIEDPKNKVLIDDTLVAHCRYNIRPAKRNCIVLPYKELRETFDTFQLCDDMKSLFKQSQFADFVIHVGVMKYRVHKLILAARSTFFSELFKNDFKDGTVRKELDIDTQPAAMKVVLLYIYSGEWGQDVDDWGLIQVFHLSHKLKLHCLIGKCIVYFKENLTSDNSIPFYKVAAQYNHKDLKNAIIYYLNSTFGNLVETPHWEYIKNFEKYFNK